MRGDMQRSRDLFTKGLRERGFTVLDSQGTYFLNVDLAPLGKNDDVAFCTMMVNEFGVAAIPVSAFYAESPITSVVRFCFAKRDETLNGALEGGLTTSPSRL
jgi:aspartate/methionine/tyrosine aminotransferase